MLLTNQTFINFSNQENNKKQKKPETPYVPPTNKAKLKRLKFKPKLGTELSN